MSRNWIKRLQASFASFLCLLLAALPLFAADEKKVPFSIVKANLLDEEGGYPVPEDSTFFAGERVHLKFNIAGYAVDEDYRVRLSYRLDFLGPRGERFAMPQGGEIDEEVFPQDEDWLPIVRASPRLPPHAESGTYKVILTATDLGAGKKTVTTELPIHVRGENPQLSNNLVIANLSFSRTRDGEPLREPVYRPGDTVWASFHITGFEIAEDNSFDVESSLEVMSDDGEVMFSFESGGETGSPFYPRRWLPAKFRLSLDDDLPEGTYTVLVSVRDKLGGETYQSKHQFQVR